MLLNPDNRWVVMAAREVRLILSALHLVLWLSKKKWDWVMMK